MNIRIVFRGLDHNETNDAHIRKQLVRIQEFLAQEPTPIDISISVDKHKTHAYTRVVALVRSLHYDCVAHHEGPDFFTEVNEVMDRLYAQLKKRKEELVDLHKQGCMQDCSRKRPSILDAEKHDEDEFDEEV